MRLAVRRRRFRGRKGLQRMACDQRDANGEALLLRHTYLSVWKDRSELNQRTVIGVGAQFSIQFAHSGNVLGKSAYP